MDAKRLDRFEDILRDGLVKLCHGEGLCPDKLPSTPDLEEAWARYAKPYMADAVENFNQYPEAALAWAAFLGMGVAHNWDLDWQAHKNDDYTSYYGPRGWDDLDEYILGPFLRLTPEFAKKVSGAFDSCALAAMGLMRHEGIETWTEDGFWAIARICGVMFRLGAGVELHRLGYKMTAVPIITTNQS